ncbi:hypothetical protein AgCh_016630 [Apium graveolens]
MRNGLSSTHQRESLRNPKEYLVEEDNNQGHYTYSNTVTIIALWIQLLFVIENKSYFIIFSPYFIEEKQEKASRAPFKKSIYEAVASEADKAPYGAKAEERKADYEKMILAYISCTSCQHLLLNA